MSVGGHLGFFYLLALRNNAPTNMGVQIPLQSLLSILLVIYSEVESLRCVVILQPRGTESTVL